MYAEFCYISNQYKRLNLNYVYFVFYEGDFTHFKTLKFLLTHRLRLGQDTAKDRYLRCNLTSLN